MLIRVGDCKDWFKYDDVKILKWIGLLCGTPVIYIYEGHMIRFPWFTGLEDNIIVYVRISQSSLEKRQIWNPRIALGERGLMGLLSRKLALKGQIVWGTWWSEYHKNQQTPSYGLIQRQIKRTSFWNQIASSPITETLRKIPPLSYQKTPP